MNISYKTVNIPSGLTNLQFDSVNLFLRKKIWSRILMLWILLGFVFNSTAFSNNSDSLKCRFYTQDDLIFQNISNDSKDIEFYISGPNALQKNESFYNLLSMKKGINTIDITSKNENTLIIKLNTSLLFDAHYLRIILETQLKISSVSVDDITVTWEDFEKTFLKNNQTN